MTALAMLLVGLGAGFLLGADWATRRMIPRLAILQNALVVLHHRILARQSGGWSR